MSQARYLWLYSRRFTACFSFSRKRGPGAETKLQSDHRGGNTPHRTTHDAGRSPSSNAPGILGTSPRQAPDLKSATGPDDPGSETPCAHRSHCVVRPALNINTGVDDLLASHGNTGNPPPSRKISKSTQNDHTSRGSPAADKHAKCSKKAQILHQENTSQDNESQIKQKSWSIEVSTLAKDL